ncbi:MAG: hypothetical protein DWQ01_17255 [Planctomycetota bacterium]|nr:MAG: hypothetical protein DWQ01_17255 [Planctomycetota bacterium]
MTSQSPLSSDQDTRDYQTAWEALSHLVLKEGKSWSGREKNCVYLNLGGEGRFANLSSNSTVDYADDARSAALVDWDDDGRLDLMMKNRTGPRVRFLRNLDESGHNFVAVKLRGVKCNRDAIGAQVILEIDGRTLRKTLYAGDGYLSQSSKRLQFGVGKADRVDTMIVRWPDGSEDRYPNLEVNTRYRVVQGSKKARVIRATSHLEFANLEGKAPEPNKQSSNRAVLADPLPMAPFPLPGFQNPQRTVESLRGAPVLINLWASWCNNCLKELYEFQQRNDELQQAGLRVVAMSTDKPEDLDKAKQRLEQFGFQEAAGHYPPEILEAVHLVLKEVTGGVKPFVLPTSLLLDAQGRLAVLYQGPVSVETLLQDAAALAGADSPGQRLKALTGGQTTVPWKRDLAGLGKALLQAGFPQTGAAYGAMAAALQAGN